MKFAIIPPAILMLALGFFACGGGSRSTGAPSGIFSGASLEDVMTRKATDPAPVGSYVKGDDDADLDTGRSDDWRVRTYGQPAGSVDRRAITTLVKRYYASAAAGDGATACSLMVSRLAREPDLGEAAEGAYPLAPGVPPLDGGTCASIMSLLFGEDHRHLFADNATLYVIAVRVSGSQGLALLGFRATPERKIRVEREHGAWKIDALLDEELP